MLLGQRLCAVVLLLLWGMSVGISHATDGQVALEQRILAYIQAQELAGALAPRCADIMPGGQFALAAVQSGTTNWPLVQTLAERGFAQFPLMLAQLASHPGVTEATFQALADQCRAQPRPSRESVIDERLT